MSAYFVHLMILVLLYSLLAQSLNLPFGLGRLFNLAHVASYAIGAYTTALLSTEFASPAYLCVPFSMVLSGFLALLVGAIALRLSQDYFAVGTLAFSAVVAAVLINWRSLTRGVLGIPGIPRPEFLGLDCSDNGAFLLFLGSVTVGMQALLFLIMRSSLGRGLRAQADFDLAAQALGRNTQLLRTIGFAVASAVAGMAGAFFAYYLNFIDPSSFGLSEMVFIVTIIIVGSPGSFWGVLAACAFLVLLPEPLRFLDIDSSVLGPMRQLLHSLILFAVVYWRRAEIFPAQRSV